jgi:hypothetical protein
VKERPAIVVEGSRRVRPDLGKLKEGSTRYLRGIRSLRRL